MKIYITDKNETRTVELKAWDNKAKNGWGPDVFSDLADDLPGRYPVDGNDEARFDGCAAAMTEAEYQETIAWWEEEVRSYNEREPGNWFIENLDEEETAAEYAKDLEYWLDCREG